MTYGSNYSIYMVISTQISYYILTVVTKSRERNNELNTLDKEMERT